MAYMAGDYYGGDYYAGGLGSILKGVVGVVKGAAKGFALGGPLGAIAGARAGLPPPKPAGTNPSNLPAVLPPAPTIIPFGPTKPGVQVAAIPGHIRRGGTISAAGMQKIAKAQALGVHPDMIRSGRRRMNVTNPRALRRALRRVAGFAKLTKRVRRAVSMAASAVGVHRRVAKKIPRR